MNGHPIHDLPTAVLRHDIRYTRKVVLDLTQHEASRIFGGGPRSFTKYETGTVRPSRAMLNLLILAVESPGAFDRLKAMSPT